MVGGNLSKMLVVLTAALVALLMAGGAAMAAKESKAEKILDMVSQDGNAAMREVRWARVAIFDGDIQDAEKILESAKKNLDATEKLAPQLMAALQSLKIGAGEKPQADLIPIDALLMLSENFVATPEKTSKIKEANEHLKKGDRGKALEILRAADVGVSITTILMPLKATIKNVNKAIALLKEQKYYEANLVLKGVQDGLITDTIGFDEAVVPAKKESTPKKK